VDQASSIGAAVAVCLGAAILEGVCAGRNVASFFTELRRPKYSAPFWLWSVIGVLYYAVFGFVLYRLIRLGPDGALRLAALVLVISMMIINGLTNYFIFRARDLRRSFWIGALFPVLDLLLLAFLLKLDRTAAISLIPYLIYRVYGVYWGYALWKANALVLPAKRVQ
jgi:translocator protein